jgi:hypothetical protein
VNTWEFQANNIAAQFGDLSNLSIFGLNMTGYSAYLNNIYMTGVVEQLLEQPISMKYTDTLGGFMGQGETDTLTFSVYRGWIDITKAVSKWKITRDTADPAEDAAWNLKDKAVNFAGTIELKFDENDLGTNADIQTAIFNVEAFGNDDEILANAEVAV